MGLLIGCLKQPWPLLRGWEWEALTAGEPARTSRGPRDRHKGNVCVCADVLSLRPGALPSAGCKRGPGEVGEGLPTEGHSRSPQPRAEQTPSSTSILLTPAGDWTRPHTEGPTSSTVPGNTQKNVSSGLRGTARLTGDVKSRTSLLGCAVSSLSPTSPRGWG